MSPAPEGREHTPGRRQRTRVFDTTLRDGLTGVPVDDEPFVATTRLIDQLQIDVVELRAIAGELDSTDLFTAVASELQHALPCILAYLKRAAIEKAGLAAKAAPRARLHVFNPTSGEHADDATLERIRDTVTFARNFTSDVQWAALDATHAPCDFLFRAIETAISAGAATIGVPDTRGRETPDQMAELMRAVCSSVAGVERAVLSTHCHEDRGLGVENSLAALESGARQVEATLTGIEPQGGNTPLEAVVGAPQVRGVSGDGVELEGARVGSGERVGNHGLHSRVVDRFRRWPRAAGPGATPHPSTLRRRIVRTAMGKFASPKTWPLRAN